MGDSKLKIVRNYISKIQATPLAEMNVTKRCHSYQWTVILKNFSFARFQDALKKKQQPPVSSTCTPSQGTANNSTQQQTINNDNRTEHLCVSSLAKKNFANVVECMLINCSEVKCGHPMFWAINFEFMINFLVRRTLSDTIRLGIPNIVPNNSIDIPK